MFKRNSPAAPAAPASADPLSVEEAALRMSAAESDLLRITHAPPPREELLALIPAFVDRAAAAWVEHTALRLVHSIGGRQSKTVDVLGGGTQMTFGALCALDREWAIRAVTSIVKHTDYQAGPPERQRSRQVVEATKALADARVALHEAEEARERAIDSVTGRRRKTVTVVQRSGEEPRVIAGGGSIISGGGATVRENPFRVR